LQNGLPLKRSVKLVLQTSLSGRASLLAIKSIMRRDATIWQGSIRRLPASQLAMLAGFGTRVHAGLAMAAATNMYAARAVTRHIEPSTARCCREWAVTVSPVSQTRSCSQQAELRNDALDMRDAGESAQVRGRDTIRGLRKGRRACLAGYEPWRFFWPPCRWGCPVWGLCQLCFRGWHSPRRSAIRRGCTLQYTWRTRRRLVRPLRCIKHPFWSNDEHLWSQPGRFQPIRSGDSRGRRCVRSGGPRVHRSIRSVCFAGGRKSVWRRRSDRRIQSAHEHSCVRQWHTVIGFRWQSGGCRWWVIRYFSNY
jgi:hypothetical protein